MRLDSPFRSIFPASLVKRGRHVTVPRVRRTPRINILLLRRRIVGNRSASQPSEQGWDQQFFDPIRRRKRTKERGRRRNGAKKKGEATREGGGEGMEAISGGVREESQGVPIIRGS